MLIFLLSFLFAVLSLETEVVRQGRISLNLFDVWCGPVDCLAAHTIYHLNMIYSNAARFTIDLG